jgi:hypothetical protein
MQSREPLPSSFELLIDELFVNDDRPAAAPGSNHFSIGSLEAAWSLKAPPRDEKSDANFSRRRVYPLDTSEIDETSQAKQLLDPNKILIELGLDANFSEADIIALRREYALRNHPDRVAPELREIATQRMMIANDLMDRYVARLRSAAHR